MDDCRLLSRTFCLSTSLPFCLIGIQVTLPLYFTLLTTTYEFTDPFALPETSVVVVHSTRSQWCPFTFGVT